MKSFNHRIMALMAVVLAGSVAAKAQTEVKCYAMSPKRNASAKTSKDSSKVFVVVLRTAETGGQVYVTSGFSAKHPEQLANEPELQGTSCGFVTINGEVFATTKSTPNCLGEILQRDEVLYAQYVIARSAAMKRKAEP